MAAESEEAQTMLGAKESEIGSEQFLNVARSIMLQTLDMLWVEHLESMEYLRGSVNLRAYGQRDPLTEYRKEGTRAFKDLEEMFKARVFELIENITKEQLNAPANPPPVITVRAPGSEKIDRNDPCPCGSGKKWKNCGLKNTEEHQRLMTVKNTA